MTLKEARATGRKYTHPNLGNRFGTVSDYDPTAFSFVQKDAWVYFPGTPEEKKYDTVNTWRGHLKLNDLLDDNWQVEP